MIVELMYFVVGFGGATILKLYFERKNKGIGLIKTAAKAKHPIIFLESGSETFLTRLIGRYHNLGITEQKELVIVSPNSIKYCGLIGTHIGHGDLYKSVLVPSEVIKYKNELKEKYGLSDEDISEFLKAVETMKTEDLQKKTIKGDDIAKAVNNEQKDSRYNLYVTMPAVVSSFINTGLNRALIFSMLKNLVAQRELERFGKKPLQWIAIGIMLLLVLFALGNWVLPALKAAGIIGGSAAATPPPTVPTAPRIGGLGG